MPPAIRTAAAIGHRCSPAWARFVAITQDTAHPPDAVVEPTSIIAGPDKALWFTDLEGSVGRITTAGQITIFRERGGPEDIVTGPDHNLWVTNIEGSVARLTTAGQITY